MVKITDPTSDLFARIRNAVLAKKREIFLPHSNLKMGILKVLKAEGYLEEVKKEGNQIRVKLGFKNRAPVVSGVRSVTRPGLRIYRKAKDLPMPLGGAGISIISTSQGVMTGREAKKKGLGGEVLGEVF